MPSIMEMERFECRRGCEARTRVPLQESEQAFWEAMGDGGFPSKRALLSGWLRSSPAQIQAEVSL